MKSNIAICDDDLSFARQLKEKINNLSHDKYCIDIFNLSEKLLLDISNYDILFLDYDMPQKNGIQILKSINHLHIIKIMVTNYDNIIYDCNELNLFWFIRKSHLDFELNKLLPHIEKKVLDTKRKFIINSNNQSLAIYIHEITYIETYKNYLFIHTQNQNFKIRSTFQNILPQFYGLFFSIPNYGILINLSCILYINFKKSTLELNNGKIFNISRKYKKLLYKEYMRYTNEHYGFNI